ncbi:MAG: DUF4430 domain-containing protein [Candidatus Bathyarchaeia archaeon]
MASKEGQGKRVWFIISLLLLSTLVVSSGVALYYYQGYVNMERKYRDVVTSLEDVSYNVDILVKYDNGTGHWYNNTLIPIGWSLFNATLKITGGDVNYSIFFGSPFITAINGVMSHGSHFWLWYLWNSTSGVWRLAETGAGDYILRDGDVVAWYLVNASIYPTPSP